MDKKLVFPVVLPDGTVQGGLTLREYYAGVALMGMISAGEEVATTKNIHAHRNEKLAGRAFEVADAMIKALEGSV